MALLNVPRIDIAEFIGGDAQAKRRVAEAVGQACCDIGFLVITGHGIERSLIEAAYRSSKQFFGLDVTEKMLVGRPEPSHIRGYSGMGTESLSQLEEEAAPPDLKELFDVGPSNVPADDPYYLGGGAAFAPNVWPTEPPDLEPSLTVLFEAMNSVAQLLSRIFATSLGIPEEYFLPKIDKHTSILRVNYYPRQNQEALPGQLRAGAHTDYTAFTILWQEEVDSGGLQVLNKAGQWVDVPYVPDSFVVNIGDSLARWTNDTWVSTMHRVVNPTIDNGSSNDRISIVFFFQPNYDTVIECISTCEGPGRPRKYGPIRNGEYLAMKFAQQQVPDSVA